MASMKECRMCNKVKDYTEFSKRTKSKDGLQDYCKACNKVTNHKFRTEIDPEHHANWQRNNRHKATEIVGRYRKADKPGLIYALVNPEGNVYIGMTKTYLSVRLIEHKAKYKRFVEGKIKTEHPLLFKSFEKYGVDNHQVKVLFEDEGIDREALKQIESSFIEAFKQKGNSLNIRK